MREKHTAERTKTGSVVINIAPSSNGRCWEGGINGVFYRIPTGVPVEVPLNVAQLIEQSASAATPMPAGVKVLS